MTELPRRPIRPLPPPAGSFEQTVARARSRRRRALVGAASASLAAIAVVAIVGTTSLAHVGAQHDLRPAVPVVSSPPSSSPPTSSAPSSAPPSVSPTPSTAAPSSASPSTTAPVVASPPASSPASPPVSSVPASPAPAVYRGRLTDAKHHPLKGYYLYWAFPDAVDGNDRPDAFSRFSLAATTGADGSFQVPGCRWASQGLLAVLAGPLPAGAQSWTYAPLETGPDNEGAFEVLGNLTIVPTITVPGGCPSAAAVTTVIRPHAIVTATLSINGRRYDATDAARTAAMLAGQPGSGPNLMLQIDLPSPNGEVQLDGIDPDPATGRVTLTGVGSGEVGFGIANQRVAIKVTDGMVLNVAVAVTTGSAVDGSDTTVTATVVP